MIHQNLTIKTIRTEVLESVFADIIKIATAVKFYFINWTSYVGSRFESMLSQKKKEEAIHWMNKPIGYSFNKYNIVV